MKSIWNAPSVSLNGRFVAVFVCLLLELTGVSAQDRDQTTPKSSALQPPTSDASAMTGPRDPATPFSLSNRYRLTPSDVIELRFPYVPEFDQTVTVQPDGYISLRVVGDLHVQGRTLPELKAMLLEAYVGTLKEPVVQIVLKEFEKPYFLVAGEVVRPGKFELRGATTLTQALVIAGGHTNAAKHSQVILFRQFTTEWLEVKEIDVKKMYASRNLSEDPLLRPGDTVFVPKSLMAKIGPLIPRPSLGMFLNPFAR